MYFDKANKYARDAYEIVNAKIGYETEHFNSQRKWHNHDIKRFIDHGMRPRRFVMPIHSAWEQAHY